MRVIFIAPARSLPSPKETHMRVVFLSVFIIASMAVFAQQNKPASGVARPKLVVGIVVDQMRWDYLYRYYDRYGSGGFKRLMTEGFNCENTFIPYTPTVTAAGHACIYTGSVPNIHGMAGNAWWDRQQQRSVSCVEDHNVKGVGGANNTGRVSPRNMLTTTIADELRMATNFRSKVIGVAFKDRGSVIAAGHSANAAYWFDGNTSNFITSTYYMNDLPQWVKDFNNKKLADAYYRNGWNTLYPINTYRQSTADEKDYEAKPLGRDQLKFPYSLQQYIGKDYWKIANTPFGNSITLEMAKAALENEKLGTDADTDMLCISFSSPDHIGHSFGPNSIEIEDTYLRLDKDLADLLTHLDTKIGKGQYTVFLSADHAAAHIPGYLKENKIAGGLFDDVAIMKQLNTQLKELTGKDSIVVSMYNYQVHLDHRRIENEKLDVNIIRSVIVKSLNKQESVSYAFDLSALDQQPMNSKVKSMISNGYFYNRGGDIQIILKPGYIDGGSTGTSHGVWNPYDSHIPMLWYGWGIKQGKTNRETYMTDIAPTLATLLKIQMPNGCVGTVIEEVLK